MLWARHKKDAIGEQDKVHAAEETQRTSPTKPVVSDFRPIFRGAFGNEGEVGVPQEKVHVSKLVKFQLECDPGLLEEKDFLPPLNKDKSISLTTVPKQVLQAADSVVKENSEQIRTQPASIFSLVADDIQEVHELHVALTNLELQNKRKQKLKIFRD